MYKSFSYDKHSLVGSENAFLARNNTPSKIPVVITSMGDENQQNRIQLAVHKYNSSPSGLLSHSRSLLPSPKHAFLKNSLKNNSYEEDSEASSRNDKKCRTSYEGVGAFPTIHLKKSAIQYRPVRRFNEVKVPNPELPLSRFFNQLPEFSTDLKSNTRSVLDVLQDLSSKKINLNESKDCSKATSKGLGGDLVVNGEAVYRPLFVQKSKSHSVLTRDNTTQTLVSHEQNCRSFNVSEPHKSTSKDDPSDVRVQLRKKLAKQNNEIFASLSSSISFTPTKRKIDKLLCQENNENLNNASDTKRFKLSDGQLNSSDKNITNFNKSDSSNHLATLNRKKKVSEINSTSPNKDRLTTIFLDMQNISPKTQVFQNNLASSKENNAQSLLSDIEKDLLKKREELQTPEAKAEIAFSAATTSSSTLPSFTFNKSETTPDFNQTVKKNCEVPSSGTSENPLGKSTFEPENQLSEKPGCEPSKVDSVNKSDSSSGDSTKESSSGNAAESNEPLADKSKFVVKEKLTTQQSNSFVMPSFANLQDKNQLSTDVKSPVKPPDSTPQFTFGVKKLESNTQPSESVPPPATTTNKNEISDAPKPNLIFGSPMTSMTSFNREEKKDSGSVLNSVPAFSSSPFFGSFGDKATFSFGKKPDELKPSTTAAVSSSVQSPSVQSIASSQTNVFTQNVVAFDSSKNESIENQKPKTSEVSSVVPNSLTSITGDKKPQPFTFTFEQKSQNVQKINEAALSESKSPSDWFTFGQKTLKPETSQNNTPPVNISNQFSSSPGALQNLAKLPQPTSLFGQTPAQTSSPQPPTTQTPVSSPNQNSLTDSITGSKLESKPSTGSFFNKTPFFGSSGPPIPASTNSPMSNGGFGAVNCPQPSNVFGVKSTTAQTPGLTSSTSSPGIGFGGNQTLNAFGASSTTKSSAFGAEANTQTSRAFGFKTSTSPSSGSNFIAPTGVQANKPFTFGSSPSAFAQPSEQISNKNTTTLGPTTNIFSQTTSSQNPVENTTFGSSSFSAASPQNVFAPKVETSSVFGHNSKTESLAFNQQQPVESQNKFSFGSSATSPTTGFPNSSATPVFNFGSGSSQGSNFSFGTTSSVTSSPNNQFVFKNPASDTFKFGTPITKENSVFGNPSSAPTFTFNNSADQKPPAQSFNFGNNQSMAAAPAFNFGATSSPSVFSFGGPGSSTSSNSTFNFGSPQPCTPFGQPAMPSAQPFSGPGTFSIGSGSSQSRPKASSRLRRRP